MQLSDALGAFQSTTALLVTGFVTANILAGQLTKTGAKTSVAQRFMAFTVTVNVQVEVRLPPSFAVYVTVEVPTGNEAPDSRLLVILTGIQASVAVGCVQFATALPVEVLAVILAGQLVKVGPAVLPVQFDVPPTCVTITLKPQMVLAFRLASLAV